MTVKYYGSCSRCPCQRQKVAIEGKTRSITEVELRKIALPLVLLTSDHF